MAMYYDPKRGWVVIPEQTQARVTTQTHHRIVSENSVQNLEQLIKSLLDAGAADANQIMTSAKKAVDEWNAAKWHRENGGGNQGPSVGAPNGAQAIGASPAGL